MVLVPGAELSTFFSLCDCLTAESETLWNIPATNSHGISLVLRGMLSSVEPLSETVDSVEAKLIARLILVFSGVLVCRKAACESDKERGLALLLYLPYGLFSMSSAFQSSGAE